MSDESIPLTSEERAELEQLRAEKREREELMRAKREREELWRLRAERDEAVARERLAREQPARRSIMEPDDDLSMPLGQKIVLIAIALIVVAIVASIILVPR